MQVLVLAAGYLQITPPPTKKIMSFLTTVPLATPMTRISTIASTCNSTDRSCSDNFRKFWPQQQKHASPILLQTLYALHGEQQKPQWCFDT